MRLAFRTALAAASLFLFAGGALAQPVHTQYAGTDEIFANPERGFYAHQGTQAEIGALTRTRLESLKSSNVRLILRIYYLKKFRTSPMSDLQLDLIRRDMDLLREVGMKAILRFAYSSNETEADAPLATIEMHLDQLQPILHEHVDVIAAVEAGLIGAWGEWYYSSNGLNTTENRRAVLQKWLSVLPVERMVQVRTPGYKKAIYERTSPLTPEEAHGGSDYARTGHHNDCFLASSSDYGTYSSPTDKPYLEADSRYTTTGGETCNPNPPRSECASALAELARFHWSYLNQDYHRTVLSSWETGGCMDEVKRRLGYRFRLVDSDLPATVRPGSAFPVGIRVTNDGFAAPFNGRGVEIILRERQTGARYVAPLDQDPRFWMPGETVDVQATIGVPADLPEGEYEVLLHLPPPERTIRDRPDFAIRVANEDVWEQTTGYNNLLVTTVVTPDASGEAYEGSNWFRPYDLYSSAEAGEAPGGASVSTVYPNPFSNRTEVTVQVPHTQPVRVRVFDVLGRTVATLHDGTLTPGVAHRFTFDPTGLPGGLYLLAIRGADFSATRSALFVP